MSYSLSLALSRSRCTRLTADVTLFIVSFFPLFVPAGRKLRDLLLCGLPKEKGHKTQQLLYQSLHLTQGPLKYTWAFPKQMYFFHRCWEYAKTFMQIIYTYCCKSYPPNWDRTLIKYSFTVTLSQKHAVFGLFWSFPNPCTNRLHQHNLDKRT